MRTEPNFYGPGVETPEDETRLLTQVAFIREYMKDGSWRTLPEICQAYESGTGKGILETSASAQLRALRRSKHGGFIVDRRKAAEGLYQYRIRQATTQKYGVKIL